MSKTPKPKTTENRCRLVYIELGTRIFHYMPWESESKADELLAFGNWALDNVAEFHGKFDVCVQYEKPIGDDGKTLAKLPDDPPLRLTCAQIIDMNDGLKRQREILGYINLAVQQFRGNNRGPNALYRAAVQILEREGADFSAKGVRVALEKAGVVRDEFEMLHWTDDKGRQKKTSWKQFDSGLSRHRKLIG